MLQQQHYEFYIIAHHSTSLHPGVVLPSAAHRIFHAVRPKHPFRAPVSYHRSAAAAMPTVGDEVYRLGLDLSNEARRVGAIFHRNFKGSEQGGAPVGNSNLEWMFTVEVTNRL